MKRHMGAWMLVVVGMLGCSPEDTETDGSGSTTADDPQVQDVRGDRYCEILIGHLEGGTVHVDVYNTYQLNDCPQEAWEAVDADAIKAEEKADVVLLNGPRYWLMDAFVGSKLVDTTPKSFGGLEMRVAGTLDLPLSEAMGGDKPYSARTVARTTTWVYEAGKPVYELVDPGGRVFDMQSFSVQKAQQSQESLESLGDKLALPGGWTFRSRVLTADLKVTAVDGMATVVQDDLANTYQLSEQ